MQLSDIGEFGFIERVRRRTESGSAVVGLGDDAAVVEPGAKRVVASADALVDAIHFRLDWSSPADVGFKAVSVNVSDIAAMGARARWLLVTVCAPKDTALDVLDGVYDGIAEASARYGTELVGGDTVRSNELVLSVAAFGEIDGEPLTRSGAQPGDVLALTGPLGKAAAGLNLLMSQDPRDVVPEDALACIDAHRRPLARAAEGLRLQAAGVHAAIDVSDGLAADATRIAQASGAGVEIDGMLPIAREALSVATARGWDPDALVLGGGEDLELLVAISPDVDVDALGLIPCGRVVADGSSLVRGGERHDLAAWGYDHFRGGQS